MALVPDVAKSLREKVSEKIDPLVESGIIDSTSVLELIEFLESHFGIEVTDAEIVPGNFGSISALTEFVERKRGVHESGLNALRRRQ